MSRKISGSQQYRQAFEQAIGALPPGERIGIGRLFDAPGLPKVSDATKRKHLRELISDKPELLERIVGFYPSPETVIDLVEKRNGKVTEENLDASNHNCRRIVEEIGRPLIEEFVRQALSDYLTGRTLTLSLDVLLEFLLDEYADFTRGAGNGLVSIAGSINERLLIRALINAGLKEGVHFTRTGTDSEADILIHSESGSRVNLGVEVKSYHARERLLRGLQDIKGLKVGVGFFQDPAEFNARRTITLLQADPAAIYMPQSTLSRMEADAANMKTKEKIAFDSRLYRPIEQFVSDMKHYYSTGILPPF